MLRCLDCGREQPEMQADLDRLHAYLETVKRELEDTRRMFFIVIGQVGEVVIPDRAFIEDTPTVEMLRPALGGRIYRRGQP